MSLTIFNNQYFQDDPEKPYVHPATLYTFDELYTGLMSCVADGVVNISHHEDGDRVLFKYNQIKMWELGWNEFSILARGLILSLKEKRIVALPYPKFFNYGEGDLGYILPNTCNSFSTYDKLDGSLGILYNWKNNWEVATAGSFISDQAKWATEFINRTWDLKYLDDYKNCTILGEIIYPENKIVVDYKDFTGFVIHGGYCSNGKELHHTNDLYYISYHACSDNSLTLSGRNFFYNIDEIVDLCKTLHHNREGFVVHFDNGYRVKIKGDDYVRIHRLISNVTPLRIWEAMLAGDNIKALKNELPEEFRYTIDEYVSNFTERFETFVASVIKVYEVVKDYSDKELGLWIADSFNTTPKDIKDCMFLMRNKDFKNSVYIPESLSRRRVFKTFLPKGNVL